MSQHPNTHGAHGHGEAHESHGSLKSYIIGFVLSIVLTIIPLVAILQDMVEGGAATALLIVTAVLQFVVQLFFFMHLKEEKGPRWNLMVLILGIVIVVTIVLGSLWIMNYNMVAH
ncbi:cytochrome o ubiquinol oxidase subunit IV [Cohnella lubricantis]|uniref:Cytochrome o ubiquinol oxidase subunit IV n=1 Tax=Cohnella lubricantis TaxID=2163172 RepID=A0A841T5X5_9BACL|nr:cytochrome o ubiquinol oxidase subunit IV [Cohnella lubricantis]MBB6676714.1 cytochrome o ubiquinol oxidase subunit IV [Cohnella lubricantis]MBP2117760.1 cytochrome o ubiquinol oxidase operon protein cyoD [Cohnella lubricantis]